jgi:serine/threonine protein kinase
MTLTAGTKLGPYEILAPLGAGGMGEVYRARDTRLGREVAVKVLPDSLAHDGDALARFEREARLLAALDHPHIAGIHGIEESGEARYLVLELVEGSSLAERLAAGPLPVDESLRIAAQIADALDAAHAKGIVHRDLKPGNVMVTPDGRAKVLDFGLAKSEIVDASSSQSRSPTLAATQAGTLLGTPAYMSPEQARGRPADKRSDIWSFGCVLYEMLAGRRPFEGATASDAMVAILGKEPDWRRLPRATPEPIRRLLARCLEKDVDRRLRDAGEARVQIRRDRDRSADRGRHPARAPRRFPRLRARAEALADHPCRRPRRVARLVARRTGHRLHGGVGRRAQDIHQAPRRR